MSKDFNFGYSFPAIRGIQAHREFFTSMCPMRLIPKIFLFNEEEVSPEMRAQRVLNKARIPAIADYIVKNRNNYAFSSITASLDGNIKFEPLGNKGEERNIGTLHVDMNTRFIINDGQHRRAAIERALQADPDLGDESIPVVFFADPGLGRCQQLFADLNRHAIRPSTSIGILYDNRDAQGEIIKTLLGKDAVFEGLVEMEKTSLARRSKRLFTLSALYKASSEVMRSKLFEDLTPEQVGKKLEDFWLHVFKNIKEWEMVKANKISSGELREDYIHCHSVGLQAIGIAGAALLDHLPKGWNRKLSALGKIDWRRKNSKLWEGRALVGGRVSKGSQNITLTSNVIKKACKLELSPEEQRAEDLFNEARETKT